MIIFTILTAIFMLLAATFTIYAYVSIKACFVEKQALPPYLWIFPGLLWGLYILFQNLLLITLLG